MDFTPGGSSPLPNEPAATVSLEALILIGIYFICTITLLILLIDIVPRICNWLKTKNHTAKLIIEASAIVVMTIVVVCMKINDKYVIIKAIEHFGYFVEDLTTVYN